LAASLDENQYSLIKMMNADGFLFILHATLPFTVRDGERR
jgi:hypothetical protein